MLTNINASTELNFLVEDTSFSSKIKILSKVLYDQQRKFNNNVELDPDKFNDLIKKQDSRLEGFFDEMVNAIVPPERKEKNKDAAKKSVVTFCYLLAGLRNKFTNSIKLDVGLYLVAAGASCTAIDTLSKMGITTSYKTIENYKKELASAHSQKINEYLNENVCNNNNINTIINNIHINIIIIFR